MSHQRIKAVVRGAVQGVGFRPFVYRLATSMGLNGWVSNTVSGVFLEAEGPLPHLALFLRRLEQEKPPRALVQSVESSFLEPAGYASFEIRHSDENGEKCAVILPDMAVCAECLAEMLDPANRRYLYPFINCTNCGPRYSIIQGLPYDRPNTTMRHFEMCPACEEEYHDPANRRFHAQPNACPRCGPQLALWNPRGKIHGERREAVAKGARALREGKIVALKGVGGFQLLVDARQQEAVRRLRERKGREEKPLAVMYPSLEAVRKDCEVGELEAQLLTSPQAPIVLLRKREGAGEMAKGVAPGNPNLGVMLPHSPPHHLLTRELNFPIVATSGNRSNEPICIHDEEALERLGTVADFFLVHNRPIARPVDDSVTRVVLHGEMILRRARGYAPMPIHVKKQLPPVLAVGSHLKNTVALGMGHEIFVSQHIGDLEAAETWEAFHKTASDLQRLYDAEPGAVACDLNRDYLSSKYAAEMPVPVTRVQHHFAHVLSCMADNELDGPVLGVAWDGTGLGTDGTIWGGEFLVVDEKMGEPTMTRAAHLRTFRLPGGDAAIKQPRRCALGLLWQIFGERAFDGEAYLPVLRQFNQGELTTIRQMLEHRVNAPETSSAGRLFDAVAAMLGLRKRTSFEGQAAMDVEFAARSGVEAAYSFRLTGESGGTVDWEPAILEMLAELREGQPADLMAAKFHNTLTEMIVKVAQRTALRRVVLTGGCFQNKLLLERAILRLRQAGFEPFWHHQVPPNDGGIAVGQILAIGCASPKRRRAAEECLA